MCRGKNSKGQWATRTKKSMKPKCLEPVVEYVEETYVEEPEEDTYVEDTSVPPSAVPVKNATTAPRVASTITSEDPISVQIGESSIPASRASPSSLPQAQEEALQESRAEKETSSNSSMAIGPSVLGGLVGLVVAIFIIRVLRKRRSSIPA
jgi:hypothetical protein